MTGLIGRPVHGAAAPSQASAEHGGDAAYESTLRFLQTVLRDKSERTNPAAPTSGARFVDDVMTKGVVAAHESAVFKEIVSFMAANHVSAVPVIDTNRRVVGVVSEADLLAHLAQVAPRSPRGFLHRSHGDASRKISGTTAAQLMTSPAVVASPDMSISSAAWLVAKTRVKRLPVVDETGVLIGIVSRSDLLRPYLRPDVEIRDDIVENVIHGAYLLDRQLLGVDVNEGVVTLDGHLQTKTLVDDLVATVRNVSGVIDVDDHRVTFAAE